MKKGKKKQDPEKQEQPKPDAKPQPQELEAFLQSIEQDPDSNLRDQPTLTPEEKEKILRWLKN